MAQNIDPVYNQQQPAAKQSEELVMRGKDYHSVRMRLQKELRILMMSQDKTVSAFPDGEDLFKWVGTIVGPQETAYQGLQFKLSLEFSSSYPYSAPVVRFVTPCYHPNVDVDGNICLDILKEKWSALYDVRTILLSVQSLLSEPNNESPLNVHAAELWLDQDEFKKCVLEVFKGALS